MGRDGRCRDCGDPIMFVASSATGRAMCLDPYPQAKGNVRLRQVADGLVADVLSKAKAHQERRVAALYLDHHATCRVLNPPDVDDGPDQLQLLEQGEA